MVGLNIRVRESSKGLVSSSLSTPCFYETRYKTNTCSQYDVDERGILRR